MTIDTDRLRGDLMDYFGTAMSYNDVAMMDLIKVENATDEELITLAFANGFNIDNYIIVDEDERSNYGKRK